MASHKMYTEEIESGESGSTLTVTKARPTGTPVAISTSTATATADVTVVASSISGQTITFPGLVASTNYIVIYEGF